LITKVCTSCGIEKILEEFGKTKKGKFGRASRCRLCASQYNKEYHIKNKISILERHANHREANRERINAYGRQHYYDCIDYYRAYAKQYAKDNPEKMVDYVARRRARMYGSTAYEVIDKRIVFERDKGICHICQLPADPKKWELEHIVPLSKGGQHNYSNVAVAHRSCNARKAANVAEHLPEIVVAA
jgi:5-methylcytosine-specific restriction endonuclease McrA